jgi:hypothetical protein
MPDFDPRHSDLAEFERRLVTGWAVMASRKWSTLDSPGEILVVSSA